MKQVNAEEWEQWLAAQNHIHVLQMPQWGMLKEEFGWDRISVIAEGEAGVQILFRRLPLGLSIAYVAKGPIGSPSPKFWSEVDKVCRKKKAVFLKIEPDLWEENDPAQLGLSGKGYIPSKTIQPRTTIIVDIRDTEDAWLERMKQKTRYNIRLAEKKGVIVRESEDIDTFYEIMISTGKRDRFGIHSKAYYSKAFQLFKSGGNVALLTAFYEGQPLATIMVFCSGERAWYFYGASNELERNRMPAYLLQMEGMRWAKRRGCCDYDLWGIPDETEEMLEQNFMERSDGLWGVYRFKRGFGGELRRFHTAYDRVYMPLLYRLYRFVSAKRAMM